MSNTQKPDTTAEELLEQGLAALERGNESEAQNFYVQARELDGNDRELFANVLSPDALYFAGLATGQVGEDPFPLMKRAMQAYEQQGVPSLRWARGYETLGYFLHGAGDFARAGESMMRAQGVYAKLPGHISQEANSAYNAGISFEQAGDYRRALAAFDIALGAAEALPPTDIGRAVMNQARADILLRLGDPASAYAGFQRAAEVFDSFPGNELSVLDAKFGAGRALLAGEKFQDTTSLLAEVADGAAKIAEDYLTMQGEEARATGLAAVELSAHAYHQLGVAYASMDNFVKAYTPMDIAASTYEAMGDVLGAAHCRGLVGDICAGSGDFEGAKRNFTAAVKALEKYDVANGLPAEAARDLREFTEKLRAVETKG